MNSISLAHHFKLFSLMQHSAYIKYRKRSFAFVSLQICRFKEQQWISKICLSSRSHLILFTISRATVTIFRWLLAANTLLLIITFEQLLKKKKTSLIIVSHSVWQTANSSACLALTFWCRCLESQKKKKKKNVRHFCRTTHNRPPWSCWKLDVCTFVLPRSQRRSAAFRTRPQSYVLHSLYNISVRRWSLFFLSVFFLFVCLFVAVFVQWEFKITPYISYI